MKKLLIGAMMLSAALYCQAESKQALTLRMNTGADIVYYLDTEPVIGFQGQSMLVTALGETSEIPMQDVDRWEIGLAEYSGVETPTADVRVTVYAGTVTVSNPASAAVCVYTAAGQQVGASRDQLATFSLSPGIYILTISDKSYKIAVR